MVTTSPEKDFGKELRMTNVSHANIDSTLHFHKIGNASLFTKFLFTILCPLTPPPSQPAK